MGEDYEKPYNIEEQESQEISVTMTQKSSGIISAVE
jgi:hypothetical protein